MMIDTITQPGSNQGIGWSSRPRKSTSSQFATPTVSLKIQRQTRTATIAGTR